MTRTPILSITNTPTVTPTPTPVPTASPTPTYLPITPVLQGTRLPESGVTISVENADRLALFARWGQGNPWQLAYTPDGKYLVVGTSTGLYFYHPDDFALAHYIDTQAAVFDLAISPDSQVVAAVLMDRVALYQISDERLLRNILVEANSADFSPDGKMLVLALGINSHLGRLQLRDVATGAVINDFGDVSAAAAVRFSPRGDFIATIGFSTTIWSVDGNIMAQNGPYNSGGSTASVSFSPDGELLAEGADYFIKIWRVLTDGNLLLYRELDLRQFKYAPVTAVAISPDGRLVAAALLASGVHAWDIKTGERLFDTPAEHVYYHSLAWSGDSETIAAASTDRGVQLWNVRTGESLASPFAHSGSYSSLAWSPDGQRLAVGAEEGVTYLFDAQDGDVVQRYFGPGTQLNSLAFSPNGRNLAVGYENRLVEIRNLDGAIEQTLEGFGYGSSDATFSADGLLFAASLPTNVASPPQVRVWNTRSWGVEKAFSVGGGEDFRITGFAMSPDQRTGAIACIEGRNNRDLIQIVSAAQGALLTTLEPKRKDNWAAVEAMAYSPDGEWLAVLVSGYIDPNPGILVWQTSDWSFRYERTIIPGQRLDWWVTHVQDSLAWSPDSRLLALGMEDGSIRILNAGDGEILTSVVGHTLWATGVAFSPDGRILASTSMDGTVALWGIR